MTYNHQAIEQKWQAYWQQNNTYKTDVNSNKPKRYVLEMFPYPSGKIHMGHLRNYAIGDAIARYYNLLGYNVLHPMGWDSFGLPAENAAIENNINPADWTLSNIDAMRSELQKIGFSYDWDRELATCLPNYYRHEQEFFMKMLDMGLAYRKESIVNWDPVDNTVLANEQVVDGRGWRSGALVEQKKLNQWFIKITDYAEELLNEIDNLDGWPESVKSMQRKWIGKSQGANINFDIIGREDKLKVYTTRPDTIFGASFCGISAGHPIAEELAKNNPELAQFVEQCNQSSTAQADIEKAEKLGFDTGLRISHPFIDGAAMPLYIANFILMDYGTGAIFGCPAHDERDREFAIKYNLPITQVVDDKGKLINSGFLNGMAVADAKQEVIKRLGQTGQGNAKTSYRLRDWGISRQRYWGCPIPVVYCSSCGTVPVPKEQLPVELPKDVDFTKAGNPLDNHPSWKQTTCPKCGGKATRETDTFDTFFESSWYFARYTDVNSNEPINKEAANYWLGVDNYIGGIEHAVMHLLYARFFTKFLRDAGYINISEPFKNLLTQGMVCHPTYKSTDGKWLYPEDAKGREDVTIGRSEKMSKSKKNVVNPQEIIAKYGADTARLFMLSDSPPDRDLEWSDAGVEGCYKFLSKFYEYISQFKNIVDEPSPTNKTPLRSKVHQAIKDAQYNYEHNLFNKVIANVRVLFNDIQADDGKDKAVTKKAVETALKLIAPITPHLAEDLWQIIGHKNSINNALFPEFNADMLVSDEAVIVVQVNGKKRATLNITRNSDADEVKQQAKQLVGSHIDGKDLRKEIYVPNKIVNFVV